MKSKLLLNSKSVRINKLCTDIKFVKNLCHKIVIYVVNLVYIIHILIAIVLQWAFTNYCNCVCANTIVSIVYITVSMTINCFANNELHNSTIKNSNVSSHLTKLFSRQD